MNIDDMVPIVLLWISKYPETSIKEFKNTSRNVLCRYHNTLGRRIRNEFNLWDTDWEPEIKNGYDFSPNHPDNLALAVIEKVWDKLHENT